MRVTPDAESRTIRLLAELVFWRVALDAGGPVRRPAPPLGPGLAYRARTGAAGDVTRLTRLVWAGLAVRPRRARDAAF